jgi:hypothetical protein
LSPLRLQYVLAARKGGTPRSLIQNDAELAHQTSLLDEISMTKEEQALCTA